MTEPSSGTILRVGGDRTHDVRSRLEQLGHLVIGCDGPSDRPCPLVHGARCRLVDLSMGIVFQLDLDDAYNREILRCYRTELDRSIPVQVIASPDQARRHAGSLEGVQVVSSPGATDVDELSIRVTNADLARRTLSEFVAAPAPPTRF